VIRSKVVIMNIVLGLIIVQNVISMKCVVGVQLITNAMSSCSLAVIVLIFVYQG